MHFVIFLSETRSVLVTRMEFGVVGAVTVAADINCDIIRESYWFDHCGLYNKLLSRRPGLLGEDILLLCIKYIVLYIYIYNYTQFVSYKYRSPAL